MKTKCVHDFKSLPLGPVIKPCDFVDFDSDFNPAAHIFSEATYSCGKCGRAVCDACFGDLTGAKTEISVEIAALLEPKVWNIKDVDKPSDGLYIGRAGQGESGTWGNPFPINRPLTKSEARKIAKRLPLLAELGYAYAGARLTRKQSLGLYAGYLAWAITNDKLDVRELVAERDEGLRPKDLICFCAPQPCHGDQLMKLAESYAYYRNERGYDHEGAVESALYIHKFA